jgi:hypothetical protein
VASRLSDFAFECRTIGHGTPRRAIVAAFSALIYVYSNA